MKIKLKIISITLLLLSKSALSLDIVIEDGNYPYLQLQDV